MNLTGIARIIRRILLELKRLRSGIEGAAPPAGPLAAVLMVAAWLAGSSVWTAGPVLAVSLGDMAKEAAGDLETVPLLIAIAFYIIGAAIVGFGLLKLKRHVDHPQQTTIGSGLIAILIGVALIAAPAVINALGDTFGIDGGSHTVLKPKL
ncbi:MAG: hypothetical protein OXP75_02930 [Rhodospirillales bacterium]|nr:hypothetical protein [Rhodospirillales bacterium]